MKHPFIVVAAIAFGVTVALIACSVVLLATGWVRRDASGVLTFTATPAQSSTTLEQFQHKAKLVGALRFTKVSVVPAEYGQKVIATATNPSPEDMSDLVSMNLLLYQGDRVVKVYSPIQDIALPAGASKDLVIDLVAKDIPPFDRCELLSAPE